MTKIKSDSSQDIPMQLFFNASIADNYTNSSQRIRVLSEDWVGRTIFCPNCGQKNITRYENNRPAADFYCQDCHEEYELKSKSGNIDTKIVDGAYSSLIERLSVFYCGTATDATDIRWARIGS